MRRGSLRTDARELLEDGRDVALELRRLVHGDLRGMFDGADDAGARPVGPAGRPRPVRALLVGGARRPHGVCHGVAPGGAGPRGRLGDRSRAAGHFFLVVDEAWAILSNLGVARWLQSSWKLSRAFGVSNMAVLHRVSDLRSVGRVGLRAGRAGPRAAGGLGDPGGLRAVARRVGGGRGAVVPLGDRVRTAAPAPAGGRPVEGRPALVPRAAPPQCDGAGDRRHRRGHGGPEWAPSSDHVAASQARPVSRSPSAVRCWPRSL